MKTLFTSLFLSVCISTVTAQNMKKIDGIIYKEISENEAKVERADKKIKEAFIRERVKLNKKEYIVTSIDRSAFENCASLKSVIIPNTITSIEWGTFRNCSSLEDITIPNSVTSIGSHAFFGCSSLTSIVIPNSVVTIADYVFCKCENLSEVVLPDMNEYSGVLVLLFSDCNNLKSIKSHTSPYPPKWVVERYNFVSLPYYATILDIKRSYGYYAYDRIKEQITQWQQKKKYETTVQWQQRVTEETRSAELQKIQRRVQQEYIANNKPKQISFRIGNYDADYQVYPISVNYGKNVFVKVPMSDAQYFKDNQEGIEVTPIYGIIDDHLAVVSAQCTINGKTYDGAETYDASSSDLTINLPPLEIDLSNGKSSATAPVQNQLIVDNSLDTDIPVTSVKNEKTFVVIIGNENYEHVSKVEFALNDAKTVFSYCHKSLGIPEKNIRTYHDATYGTMLTAIKDIASISAAYKGDINVIFYYAGHGIPNESSGEAFLLPVDADGTQSEVCYSVSRLYSELGMMNARQVTVFMDACFSGAQRGDGMLVEARGVAIKAKASAPKGNMVVFSAANGDETAHPYKEKGHGLFTYYLLKKIQESKGDCTLGDLGSYISEKVAQESVVSNGKSQTPRIFSSLSLGDGWKTMKLK